MTFTDPPSFPSHAFLFAQTLDFPGVVALPARQSLPDGEVLTYHFANGYGAVVSRASALPQESAFEFGVLDCTGPEPQLTLGTPVAASVLGGLSYDRVAHLLAQAERLPLHPDRQKAILALEDEEF